MNAEMTDARRASQKAYRERNKERLAQKNAEYRERNKERLADKHAEWLRANTDVLRQRARVRYVLNKERVAEQKVEYRKRNKERLAKRDLEYRERNRERLAEMARERNRAYYVLNRAAYISRARFRQAHAIRACPPWADLAAIKAIYEKAQSLKDLGLDVHVDHDIPLRGKLVSGLHVETNLKLMLAHENRSKSNRWTP